MGWNRARMLRRMYIIYMIIQREALKTGNTTLVFSILQSSALPRGAFPVSRSFALPRGTLTCLVELYLASRSVILPRGALPCLAKPCPASRSFKSFALPREALF